MDNEILILGIKSYNFKNDNDEQVSGCKVSYISKYADVTNGYLPIQVSVDTEVAKQLTTVPGVYESIFVQAPGKGNRPELKIVGFKFKRPYEFKF